MGYYCNKILVCFRAVVVTAMVFHISFLTIPRCGAVFTAFHKAILNDSIAMNHQHEGSHQHGHEGSHHHGHEGSHQHNTHHQSSDQKHLAGDSIQAENTCECFLAKYTSIIITFPMDERWIEYRPKALAFVITFLYKRWSPDPAINLDPPHPRHYA